MLAAALLTEGLEHIGTANAADVDQGKSRRQPRRVHSHFQRKGPDRLGWRSTPVVGRDGVIRGETTTEKPAQGNTFLIWRGGKVRDFVLKLNSAFATATRASNIAAGFGQLERVRLPSRSRQ